MLTKKVYIEEMKKRFGERNVNSLPMLDSVIVSMWIWSLVTRKGHKDFTELENNLIAITGQKPKIVKAKKSVSNFKLREGMPVMLQCTLRGQRALDFCDRLVKVVLPRVRDFEGFNKKSFDKQANITVGLKNYNLFPEIWLDDVSIPMWLGMTFVTTASKAEDSIALMEWMWFIFKK